MSIRTVDTNVVVLAVTSAQRLDISELWVAFGAWKSFRFLATHEIARALGPDLCVALPMFNAFTGCDTFWRQRQEDCMGHLEHIWQCHPSILCLVARPSPQSTEEWLGPLDCFVVLQYNHTSSQECVKAQKQLFTQAEQLIVCLLHSLQHIKRAAFQAGHC